MFLPSGVMAQNIILSINRETSGSNSFICNVTSHLLLHEKDAYAALLNMKPLVPEDASSEEPMSGNQISAILSAAQDNIPGMCIFEVPERELGAKCQSIEQLQQISLLLKKQGISFHCDGARLWEAQAFYDKDIRTVCNLFDSMYVSFYKGLGAQAGAMLLGTSSRIASARIWLRRMGGNLFTLAPLAIPCWSNFKLYCNDFSRRREKLRQVVAMITSKLGKPSSRCTTIHSL